MKSTKFRTILAGGVLLSTVVLVVPQTLAATKTSANGYLYVSSPTNSQSVQQWIERLGGNSKFATSDLRNANEGTTGETTASSDAFAQLVTQSGGEFGTGTWTPTGRTYQGYPVYQKTYPIYESNQPKAMSISVSDDSTLAPGTVKQGDPIDFSVKSAVNLWPGKAKWHYDSIQLTNESTGQSVWAVGSGNTGMNQMKVVSGGGIGYYTDTTSNGTLPEYPSVNLQPGTYMAKFWVSDGLDRISAAPATTRFTVVSSSGESTTAPSSPTITLVPSNVTTVTSGTAVPLSYSTSGWQSGYYVRILPSETNVSDTWSTSNDTTRTDSLTETANPQNDAFVQV